MAEWDSSASWEKKTKWGLTPLSEKLQNFSRLQAKFFHIEGTNQRSMRSSLVVVWSLQEERKWTSRKMKEQQTAANIAHSVKFKLSPTDCETVFHIFALSVFLYTVYMKRTIPRLQKIQTTLITLQIKTLNLQYVIPLFVKKKSTFDTVDNN